MFYALLVFLAGCSYGLLAPIYKSAYNAGFSVGEVVGSQNYLGLFMLIVINLLFFRPKINLKTAFILMAMGIPNILTGILYGTALQTLSAAVAVVFLFQFTWIGIVLEAIVDRKWPSKGKIIAIPFLLIGTLMAGGIFELSEVDITLIGAFWGFLSAITFALFIFISGRIVTDIPAINRSLFFVIGGAITISLIYPPKFFINGVISEGLLFYGIPLGIFGAIIPPLFFAKGAPHVGSGLASILGASELPVAVFLASIILNEQVSMTRWLGVVIVLLGISMPYLIGHLTKTKTSSAQV